MEDETGRPWLSDEQLGDALGDRIRRPCPICDGVNWSIPRNVRVLLPTQHHPDTTVKFVREGEGRFSMAGVVILPIECENCGFIAQFRYKSLTK